MADIEHAEVPAAAMHPLIRWPWANEAERLAEPVVAGDIHKLGYQASDSTYWFLSDTTPTVWTSLGNTNSLLGVPLDASVGAPNQGDFLIFDGTEWIAGKAATVDGIGEGIGLGLNLANSTAATLGNDQYSPLLALQGGYGSGNAMVMFAQLRADGPVFLGSADPSRELSFFYTEDLIGIDRIFGLATNGVNQRLTVYGATRGEMAFETGASFIADADELQVHSPADGQVTFWDGETQYLNFGRLFGAIGVLQFSDTTLDGVLITAADGANPGIPVGISAGSALSGDNDGGYIFLRPGLKSGAGADGTCSLHDAADVPRVEVTADRDVRLSGLAFVRAEVGGENVATFELDPVNGPTSRRMLVHADGASEYFHIIGEQPSTNIHGFDVGVIGADGGPGGGSTNGGDAFLQGGKKNSAGSGGSSQLRDPDGVARVSVEGGDDRNVLFNGELLVDIQVAGNSKAYASTTGFNIPLLLGANTDSNLAIHDEPSDWNGMEGGIFIGNAVDVPTAGDAAGVFVYGVSGALKARGGSDTETTMAAAEPHCPTCGNDFVVEWRNPRTHKHLAVCMWCATEGVPLTDAAFIRKAA